MSTDGHIPLARFRRLERVAAKLPALSALEAEIHQALDRLSLPQQQFRGRRIAVAAGSRGVARVAEVVRAICRWLETQGARPFVFPAMGSHGGATAEGQLKILEGYGITPEFVGGEIRASMDAASLGATPEGFQVFMDRNAWEADGVVVMNRVKPHTDFTGKIESGLLKMMAVGMGKVEGASETHRWGWKYGFEKVIRAMSGKVLASGKILCGVAVIENEFHELAAVRAARPEGIVAQEEEALALARTLVPRIPFSKFQVLIVDELGKNISGAGMDTKVIGRGVELRPGQAPEIAMIYVRDLTPESVGNAVGIGFADLTTERLREKIDFQKTYINTRTAMNPPAARLPLCLPSDREALDVALGHLGSPEPDRQRIVWIRNTLSLRDMAISEVLSREVGGLDGWRLTREAFALQFDRAGNLIRGPSR